MAKEDFAAYAPPANIIEIIKKQRQASLPDVIDSKLLVRIGMRESIVRRIQSTLIFLGLVDENEHQTEKFRKLRKATPDEYPAVLAELIHQAYSSVFDILPDLANASETELNNAFWHYEPQGQRTRMVTLFLGLCREAGLITQGTSVRSSSIRKPPKKETQSRQDQRKDSADEHGIDADDDASKDNAKREKIEDRGLSQTPKYQLMQVLLSQLPTDGKWTQRRRDQWLEAVAASVNLLIEVTEDGQLNDS